MLKFLSNVFSLFSLYSANKYDAQRMTHSLKYFSPKRLVGIVMCSQLHCQVTITEIFFDFFTL